MSICALLISFCPPLPSFYSVRQQRWFTRIRDKDICLLASTIDVGTTIPTSLLSLLPHLPSPPPTLLKLGSSPFHRAGWWIIWDSRCLGCFRPPSQITRVTRHCLLSTVTSLCRTKKGAKELGGGGETGVLLDGSSDLWKIKCDSSTNDATLCLLCASSNSHSSVIISSPHPCSSLVCVKRRDRKWRKMREFLEAWVTSKFFTAVDLKGAADTETGYFCSNQSQIKIQMRAEDRHADLVYLCWERAGSTG